MPFIPRRVVTGHDEHGVSVFASDGPVPAARTAPDGALFYEIWGTSASPAPVSAGEPDPTAGALRVPPPPNGTKIRINEFPPGVASPVHRTQSVDYGIVLSGDLRTKIGAPLKASDEMFQVAEMEKIRAEISVPEDQIMDLRIGQHGELAASTYPGLHVPFTVERINPMAEVVSAHNVFKVRVKLDGPPAVWMKPGMEGIAKVQVDRRAYGWLWTHRLVNWVRMKLWM